MKKNTKHSPEAIIKMRLSKIGKLNPMFGKNNKWGNHTEEAKNKISKAFKGVKHPFYGKKRPDMKIVNFLIRRKGLLKGKNNPNHGKTHTPEIRKKISLALGGTGIPHENSKYPYEFFQVRSEILERDNFECQNCGCTQEEHLILYGQDIEVHHINYDKENCSKDNLITTCKQCNLRANINRKYWQEYYNEKIERVIYESR